MMGGCDHTTPATWCDNCEFNWTCDTHLYATDTDQRCDCLYQRELGNMIVLSVRVSSSWYYDLLFKNWVVVNPINDDSWGDYNKNDSRRGEAYADMGLTIIT